MATYWTKMEDKGIREDEAIRKYEAERNDPSDPTDDELTDVNDELTGVNTETVDSIMNFLEDLNSLELYESEIEIIPTDADLLEIFQYEIFGKCRKGFFGCQN